MTAKDSFLQTSRAQSTAWPRPSWIFWRTAMMFTISATSRTSLSSAVLPLRSSRFSSVRLWSKWSSMMVLFWLVMSTTVSMPEAWASSTTYCTTGFLKMGSISLGMFLVAGSDRVPQPATGMTTLRTSICRLLVPRYPRRDRSTSAAMSAAYCSTLALFSPSTMTRAFCSVPE